MAKGKKKTQPLSSTETDAGAHEAATQPAAQPAEDILGLEVEFTCSSCGSHLDPSKINEAKCWLCGADNFVNEAEAELERGKREAEKKEFCCPNPNCARPLELLRSSEKYCAGCGVPLEKATPDVWFRKCVEPALAQNAARLLTGRAGFIEAAWQMGLTKEAAEIRLDDYHASNGGAPVEQSGRKRLPEVEPVQPEAMPGATHTVPVKKSPTRPRVADPADRLARVSDRLRDSYRRQRELRLKYAFGVVCLVIIGVVIILSIPSKKPPEEQVPTPTPSASVTPSATATPSPTASPTPLQMVLIEGGEFQMGRDMKDGGDPYESPSHPVTLNAFYIDVYEVTREEYQKCIDDGKCEKPSEWNGGTYPADTGRLPVTGVTWEDANRYALWAGKRLPTEEEWEFAARGAEGRLYPWGNNWKPGQANIGSDGLAEVGSFKGTLPVKLFDMIGNAQEWTSSGFRKYPDKKTYLLTGFPPEQLRVIRGGSYKDSPGKVTATYRDALRMSGEASYAQTGFRCVRNAPPPPVN